jgi:hypothetical protein
MMVATTPVLKEIQKGLQSNLAAIWSRLDTAYASLSLWSAVFEKSTCRTSSRCFSYGLILSDDPAFVNH